MSFVRLLIGHGPKENTDIIYIVAVNFFQSPDIKVILNAASWEPIATT